MDICKPIPVMTVFVWVFLDKKTSKVFLFTGMCSVDIILIFQCKIHIVRFVIGLFNKSHAFNAKNKKLFFAKHLYHKT